LIHAQFVIRYYRFYDHDYAILTEQTFWTGVVFLMVLAPVLLWLMTLLASRWYYKMIAFDMKSKARPVLIYNCLAYATGASVLAIIPFGLLAYSAVPSFLTTMIQFLAPLVALVWMGVNWYIVGTKRLYVKTSSVVIATVLVWLGVVFLFAAALVGTYFLWGYTIGSGGIQAQ
jgi:hypothetical protein